MPSVAQEQRLQNCWIILNLIYADTLYTSVKQYTSSNCTIIPTKLYVPGVAQEQQYEKLECFGAYAYVKCLWIMK